MPCPWGTIAAIIRSERSWVQCHGIQYITGRARTFLRLLFGCRDPELRGAVANLGVCTALQAYLQSQRKLVGSGVCRIDHIRLQLDGRIGLDHLALVQG